MTLFVMGTGSRSALTDQPKVIYSRLEQYVLELRQEYPELILITGMAEGWDEMIATVGERNSIPFDAYIPNSTYGQYYWQDHSLLRTNRFPRFQQLLDSARNVIYVSTSIYVNGLHANFVRNQAMVDACDMALVYKATSSGTRDAVARLTTARKPFCSYPFEDPFVYP